MFQRNRTELTGNIVQTAHTEAAGEATVTRARLIHNESVPSAGGDPIDISAEITGRDIGGIMQLVNGDLAAVRD